MQKIIICLPNKLLNTSSKRIQQFEANSKLAKEPEDATVLN